MKRYLIMGLAVLTVAGFSPAVFADNDGGNWRRDNSRHRRHRNNDNNGTIVISDNNAGYNYNNANYLGYPPWYRLNYYTPWLSDYRDGTAWTRIPSSHAAEGYGMPSSFNTMPSGYYRWLAANSAMSPGYDSAPAPYAGNISTGYAPPVPNFPQGPAFGVAQPSMPLAGNDIVVVVQRELRRRGFYQGSINGLSDSATRSAIRSYEASAGLPATGGIIGIDLLRSLRLL